MAASESDRLQPGTDAWRAWLETAGPTTFRFVGTRGTFSARREAKADRGYWYAYRKLGGRLAKAYLGRSEDLTCDRLESVAAQLARRASATPDEEVPASPTSHVPRSPNTLIGRAREVEIIARQILRPESRLLTLIGPGGTGKTRLAIAVAEDVSSGFEDGTWFIDLSAIEDTDLVVPEIARHVGIRDVGESPVRERLHQQFAARHALLVLDNMEQVLGASSEVAALLQACPRVHVLVTSREPLHLELEMRHAVPPLAVPDLRTAVDLAQVRAAPAVDLFLTRSAAAGANIELTQKTARDLVELCARLDGLPLAIELAAARSRLLRPRDMLERITRQLELLHGRADGRPDRHQSLRAAIGWSYELLTEAERGAFRALSVFVGGCSLDAAEAVIALPDALDLIGSLIDRNLVRNEQGSNGQSRLIMLETIRAFGLEQLAVEGEQDRIHSRHASYFLGVVRPPTWDALDLPEPDWLERVAPEHDNVRSALRWSLAQHEQLLGLELATAVQGFWMLSGYLREGLSWIEQAIANADDLEPKVQALAHHAAGQLAWRQGDYDRAEQHYAAGLALRRSLGDTLGSAVALQGLASVARDRGDLGEAIVLWEQCVAVFKGVGHRVRTARASLNLAIALHLAGQSERAAALLDESIQIAREVGQTWAEATGLTYRGLIALEVAENPPKAAAHVRAALPLAPKVSDAWVTVHLLELAAWLAAGDVRTISSAASLFAASNGLREQIGASLHPAFAAGHERWLAHLREVNEEDGRAASESSRVDPDESLQVATRVVRQLEKPFAPRTRALADVGRLSAREREIAVLVAEGLTSREIADRLIVAERTVETHVDHIRAKLGVRSRAQIGVWVAGRGFAPVRE